MKIVVCIKQVPATNKAKIDPETKRIVRKGIKAILNPFDTYAVEEGVQLRDKFGGEVIALSMGSPKAEVSLREAVSVGVDRAIKKIGDVNLVICGKQAIDGDTAQVGPGIAAHLDWLQATYIMAVEEISSSSIRVKRMHEDGYDICEMSLPAVITVVKDINTPRIPSLKGRLASKKCEIPVWKPNDIGADTSKIGLDGSPTRVIKTQPPAPRHTSTKKIEGSSIECAQSLLRELRLRSIV